MKEPLKSGDRVRLKGYSCGGKRVDGCKGSVLGIDTGGDIEVSVDNSGDVIVTPSQCVRLVKRERRVWTLVDCPKNDGNKTRAFIGDRTAEATCRDCYWVAGRAGAVCPFEEIAKLRAECSGMGKLLQSGVVVKTDEYISMVDLQLKLAAVEKLNATMLKSLDYTKEQLAASEAREVGLRRALENIKWRCNCEGRPDKRHCWSMSETAAEALRTTEPPALLGVLKGVEEALEFISDIKRWTPERPIVSVARDALASLRKAMGVRG